MGDHDIRSGSVSRNGGGIANMDVQRLAAFTHDGRGGNPAGVVIRHVLPDDASMQALAAEIAYSATVFAAPARSDTSRFWATERI